jgi:hypothetical protein
MENFFELDRMQFEVIPLPVEPPLRVSLRLIGCPAEWGVRISGLAAW